MGRVMRAATGDSIAVHVVRVVIIHVIAVLTFCSYSTSADDDNRLPALKIRVVGDSTRHIPQRISLLHNRGWGVTFQSQVTEAGGLSFHCRRKRLEGYLSSSQVIEAGGLPFIITVN